MPREPNRAATGTWRRALVLLWVGQVISHFGDALFLVGIFFLALEITGSKATAGLLLSLNFVPALGLGLFAGAFADRHDRRRVMLAADLLRLVAVAAIPVLYTWGQLTAPLLGAALFLLATGSALFNPAMKAIVPELVPPQQLTTAAALFQLSEFAALVAGPALAGLVVIPALGSIHLFTIDAATFLVSGLCVLALAPIARRPAHALGDDPTNPGRLLSAAPTTSVWQEVRGGVREVLAFPVLRPLVAVVALDNLLLAGLYQVATPVLVKDLLHLGGGADTGAATRAYASAQAFFFLGLLVASAGFWVLLRRAPKGRAILVGIMLDGLTFLPLAFCRTLGQVQAALFFHAIAVPLMIIPRTVLIQQLVPGALHGRAFALLNVTVFGMTAVSTAATGLLTEWLPPQTLYLVVGSLGALVGLAALGLPTLRSAR
jgi:DHA3 family macrolide efflux protein-like MFS transporter